MSAADSREQGSTTASDTPAGAGDPGSDAAGSAGSGGGGSRAARGVAAAAERVGAQVERGVSAGVRELSERRGLRTALVGLALVIAALVLGGDSALTVPLLVLGIVLLILGVMGPRLSGHFSVEFGSDGTRVDLRTEIAAPGRVAPPVRGELEHAAADIRRLDDRVRDAEVVEGQGETIEIDVAELRSLMASAEDGRASRRPRPEDEQTPRPPPWADRRTG